METKIDDILQIIKAQTTKLENLDAGISGIKQTIHIMSEKIETISNKISTIEHKQEGQGSDIKTIKTDLEVARLEINILKQQSLNADFILYGLPPDVTSDDSKEILKNFAEAVDFQIEDKDIAKCYARHNKGKTESLIIGSFSNATVKNDLKKRFAARKPVVVESVIPSLTETSKWRGKEVVMKNQLTEYNRELLREAHQLNEGRFKYVWESNGRIMLRKADDDRPITVRTKTQLIEAMSTNSSHNPSTHQRQQ